MGLMDKLKAAAQAVTGGAAVVSLEYEPQVVFPGAMLKVRITATSSGGEVKSNGAFVDFRGHEEIRVPRSAIVGMTGTKNAQPWSGDIRASKDTFEQAFPIAPAFTLGANETKQFEGTVQLPGNLEPSYRGAYAEHRWEVRGRIEAFGNDPDSGWQPLRIGVTA